MMDPLIPWYIAGPLLGLIVPLLLVLREKQFGVSSSYRYVLSWPFPKVTYFAYNRSADSWQLHFALGLVLAGVIVSWFFLRGNQQL